MIHRILKLSFLLFIISFVLAGCATLKQDDLVGRWDVSDSYIDDGNGQKSDLVQAVVFNDDATCEIMGIGDPIRNEYKIESNTIIFIDNKGTNKSMKCYYSKGKVYLEVDMKESFKAFYSNDELNDMELPVHKFVLTKTD